MNDTQTILRMEALRRAIERVRTPYTDSEYQLHALIAAALADGGFDVLHEAPIAPRCRVDFLCEGVGIEVKRGRAERARVLAQLRRYAACERVRALVLVTERTLALPDSLSGKPLRIICLSRLWGIAL